MPHGVMPGETGQVAPLLARAGQEGGTVPPHCDSLDGPVVTAAARALDTGDIGVVLPFVPESGEPEAVEAFEKTSAVRTLSPSAQALADRYFFETVVRIHRSGEGAPYTGLRPAGLDVGPVIPAAERAVETGSADELVGVLTGAVREEVEARLAHAVELKRRSNGGVEARRAFVQAMLGLEVWSHTLCRAVKAHPHEHEHEG